MEYRTNRAARNAQVRESSIADSLKSTPMKETESSANKRWTVVDRALEQLVTSPIADAILPEVSTGKDQEANEEEEEEEECLSPWGRKRKPQVLIRISSNKRQLIIK